MAGGFNTVNVAEALPVEPVFVPPFVDEINPLTFWCDPSTVPVTLTLTVHEPLAGIVAPVGDPKVSNVAPAVGAHVGVLPHVVAAEGVAATCKPDGSESLKITPVRAIEFELDSVKVNVETPLIAMELGEKALVIAGGTGVAQPVNVTLSRLKSFPLDVALAP
jgi:hypothetical protein